MYCTAVEVGEWNSVLGGVAEAVRRVLKRI
jgi:hypothetical protein